MAEEIIKLTDDITLDPVRAQVQGQVLIFDPKRYTVAMELKLQAMQAGEQELLDAGKLAEARDYAAGLLESIIHPADVPESEQLNHGWDKETIKNRLSVDSIGRAIGFFGLVGSGRLPAPPPAGADEQLPPLIPGGEALSIPKSSSKRRSAVGAVSSPDS